MFMGQPWYNRICSKERGWNSSPVLLVVGCMLQQEAMNGWFEYATKTLMRFRGGVGACYR